jgi:hypothetical protein
VFLGPRWLAGWQKAKKIFCASRKKANIALFQISDFVLFVEMAQLFDTE